MKKNTPGKIKNNYELYMALGNGSIEINDAIILLNRINKKGIVIGNCCECKKYIEDTINKIKRDKNYINNSIEKPKNEENTVKYFENILQGELKINEEVLKISFKLKDGKKEKDNVELVRKIELPDNMLNNNIKMSDEFKSAIMNYLINMKSLSIFDTGLIQFFHPGGEHIVDKPCSKKNGKKVSYSDALIKGIDNGIMLWNDAPEHRRKYICCSGKYISHDKYDNEVLSEKTKILFWGEWEPQSKIICKPQLKIKHSSGSPQYIHEPYISRNIRLQNPKDLQNTDPYVFGEDESHANFHYCCCKQNSKKGPTDMQKLKIGNIILFGSYKKNKFLLDTVFVVADEGQPYSRFGSEKLDKISDVYKFASIDKVRRGNKCSLIKDNPTIDDTEGGCNSSKNEKFKLYTSASYDSQVNKCFSFFPCKVFNENDKEDNLHPRVSLDLNKFGLSDANEGMPKYTNAGQKNAEFDNLFISQHFVKNYLRGMYTISPEFSSDLESCIRKLKKGEVVGDFSNIMNRCYWNALANEVLDQGYYLGVYAEEPKF